jgi:hypothetical protein
MINFNCNIKVKHNFKNIDAIIQKLPQTAKIITEDVLKNIRGYAIRLEKGHNEEGILVEMVDMSTKEVKGRVYTDKDKFPWAMFEHFGTGDFRELPPVGTTKHFLETGGSQWFIPVSKVEKALPYPIVNIQGMDFYIAHGTKANHFMGDAEFESRNENTEIVKKKIDEMLKEVCK